MNSGMAVELIRDALMAAFWTALPLLAIGFVVGIAMSLVQVLTSIQDTAFGTVPRLIAFLVGILFLLPWFVQRSVAYTSDLLVNLDKYAQ